MKKVFFIGGNKGGVGKSFIANSLIYFLTEKYGSHNITVVDTDSGNPDVFFTHDGENGCTKYDSRFVNIDTSLMPLITEFSTITTDYVVVNTHAGALSDFLRAPGILTRLTQLVGEGWSIVWSMGISPDCAVALEEMRRILPANEKTKYYIVFNYHFGNERSFRAIFDSDLIRGVRAEGGVVASVPAMHPDTASKLSKDRMQIGAALKAWFADPACLGEALYLEAWEGEARKNMAKIVEADGDK